MFAYFAHQDSLPWQPGPYPGVELKILHKNPNTQGLAVLRKFTAGTTVPAHTHPHASETVYILAGEWVENGSVHSSGSVFHAPKGEQHGPHFARTEVLSLTIFDGPLTVS